MPGTTAAAYRGANYGGSYGRSGWSFRPTAGTVYLSGSILQMVAQDSQVYPDESTAGLSGTAANQMKLCGVVSETWPGFNASIGTPTFTAPSNLVGEYGTTFVVAVVKGYHPGVLIDQSGSGAVTIVDGLAIIASRATAGYGQGGSASAPAGGSAVIANAALPAAGIGSSITAAALAQASQTDTITGTPAVGDTLSVTIQSSYIASAAGTAQTTTCTTPPLNAAQAVSVTTAAAALVAYLNAQTNFALYFTATNSSGVVTVTVNTLASLFTVNFSGGVGAPGYTSIASAFQIGISGMVANSLSFAVAATGGSVATPGGAVLAGGTGYKGPLPAWVCSTI